jgi:hypothetical protein
VVNGVLYAVGGLNNSTGAGLATNEAFTPASPSVTLFSADPQFLGLIDLTTDGTSGFYLSGYNTPNGTSQQIFRVGMSGGSASVFAPAYNPNGITTDGTNVYWIDPNGDNPAGGGATAVFSVPIGGGATSMIYSGFATGQPVVDGVGIAFVPGSGSPGTLVTADDVQGRVDSMTASNPVANITQLGPDRYGGFFNEEHSNSIAVAGGVVYVADSGNSSYGDTPPRVESIPLSGGSFTTLYTGSLPGFSPHGIAINGNTLYLTSGNQILQMPTTGGTPSVLVSDARFGSLGGLTYFNNALYVVDQHAGSAEVWQVSLGSSGPATPTVNLTDSGGTYDSQPFPGSATAKGAGGVTVNGSFSFTYYAGSSATGTGSATAPSSAGTYTVVASFTSSDPNYTNAQSSPVTFAIAPAAPTVTVTDAGGTYDGQPFQASATATGIGGAAVSGSFTYTYYQGNGVNGSGTAAAPIDPGTYTVLAAFASSDPNYTSGTSTTTFNINSGTPPSVTLNSISSPTTTATPAFSGTAGTAAADLPAITVNVYSGSSATGTPVETLTATASGGVYSVTANPALADGTYTAQASQSDSAGDVGTSSTTTFTVDAVVGLTPTQVRKAYGINQISFPAINGSAPAADGTGQTIAIVDPYDDPTIAADLQVFDQQFGLADAGFTKVGIDANGNASTTQFPPPNADWAGEIELDVEWAHAVAPGANILLVEANSSNNPDLLSAVSYASNQPGVVVVSMSWASPELPNDSQLDRFFSTPAGHAGVTFIAAAGDNGAPAEWPAVSSHVVGVGGTTLSVDALGNYKSEAGWSGGGGGLSGYVSQPSYQHGVVSQSSARRASPDVAFDADPGTGVAVYGQYGYGGWSQTPVGGTSVGAPQWAGLMALADQGRSLVNKPSLDGFTQTLPMLYNLPSTDFNDITTGSNGLYQAGAGFDLVSGLGSPKANLLVPALAGLADQSSEGSKSPTIVIAANVVSSTNSSVTLNALGSDTDGASSLIYTWSAFGPAPVQFSSNGTTATHYTTATFTRAGTYVFLVNITDKYNNLSVFSQVSFTVNQVLTSVSMSAARTKVVTGSSRPFSATALDQFGASMAVQPGFVWTLARGSVGTLSSTGVYEAPATGTGSATVVANTGALRGTAKVQVLKTVQGPSVVTAAHVVSRTPRTVTLGVQGADEGGAASLSYSWLTIGPRPGPLTFSRNNTNAASTTTVTFTQAGNYTFLVIITDSVGLTYASQVTVTVSQVLSTVSVSTGLAALADGGTEQLSATALDQFGHAMSSQPRFVWALGAGSVGSLSSTGQYKAPATGAGSATILVKTGTLSATARILVVNGSASQTLATDGL